MSLGVRSEDGSLNIYCLKCDCKLDLPDRNDLKLVENGRESATKLLCTSCKKEFEVDSNLLMYKEFGVAEQN